MGPEASEEGDKPANTGDHTGSDQFHILVVGGESIVLRSRRGRVMVVGGVVLMHAPPFKKNHCNDATDGNRSSCAELKRQN